MKIVLCTLALLFVADNIHAQDGLLADPAGLNDLMGGPNGSVPAANDTAAAIAAGFNDLMGGGSPNGSIPSDAGAIPATGGADPPVDPTFGVDPPVPSSAGAIPAIGGGPNLLTKTQEEMNTLCNQKCRTEQCYLSDNDDCRNFITCQLEKGAYRATLQPCAFGTFWAGLQQQKKITCDALQNVACKIDYCRGQPNGTMFDHKDGNCKTYWECIDGNPVPKCCDEGMRFRYNRRKGVGKCVRARGKCHDKCPIKKDACLIPGTKTEFFDDRNCVTYWNCEERHPHPVCCPEGQGYDVIRGCINNPLCKDECPPQYKPDICLQPGIEKYSLLDGSCRTYMKCNAIEGDERWCCPSGYLFDSNTQDCIGLNPNMNITCSDDCPQHYEEVCLLKPAFNKSDAYIVNDNGIDVERPCSPGTQFDVTKCGCATHVPGAPDNSCNKEVDITFDQPAWNRDGAQDVIKIDTYGTPNYGPNLNGRSTLNFKGDLVFRIPYFQSPFEELYLKIVYLPQMASGKQILLSNCMSLDVGGGPTLDLALQSGLLVLNLVTETSDKTAPSARNPPAQLTVPYTPGIWNTATVVYGGKIVQILNEGEGLPTYDFRFLNGTIPVAAEGLDFGACYIQTQIKEGYTGSVAKLEVSKCVNMDWKKQFDLKVPEQQPLIK